MTGELELLPITVIAATAIFVLKELLEYYRRWSSNRRKIEAIRTLLAGECERNHFAISRMSDQAQSILDALSAGDRIEIHAPWSGREEFAVYKDDDDEIWSGSPIPHIQSTHLEKNLLDAASIDKKLFRLMDDTVNTINNLNHLRNGFIKYPTEEITHLGAFAQYAKRELDKEVEAIGKLYFYCTCEPLVAFRVR